jgi:hypothetical protein
VFPFHVLLPRFGRDMRSPCFLSSSTSCHLSGNRYNDEKGVKTPVNSCLLDQTASFYEEITLKLVERHDKYLKKLGN